MLSSPTGSDTAYVTPDGQPADGLATVADVAAMPDVFPDLVQLAESDLHANVETLAQSVQAECEGILADVRAKLLQAAADCERECREALDGCSGCLAARTQALLASVQPTLDKCRDKIGKAAMDRYALTMRALGELGLPYPDDSVVNAIASGVSPADAFAGGVPADLNLDDKATLPSVQDKLDAADIHPATAADIGDKPLPQCPPGYLTYVVNGKVTCYKPPSPDGPGQVLGTNDQGELVPVEDIPYKPPGGGTTGGGGTTPGTTTDTGGNPAVGTNQCSEGTTVQEATACYGTAGPEQVWYVVTCKPTGQAQLDTYHGWNKPAVDDASIIASGDYATTSQPTEAEVLAYAAKLCVDKPTGTTPTPPKPAGSPTLYCDPDKLAKAVVDTPTGGGAQELFTSDNNLFLNFKCDDFSRVNPVRYLCDVVQFVLNYGVSIANGFATNYACLNDQFTTSAVNGAALGAFGGWFGLIPEAFQTTNRYSQNLACQYLLPSAADAVNLGVRGFLNDEQFKGLSAANGVCLPWANLMRDASYTRPDVLQSIQLFRREELDVDEFKEAMKRNGVKDDDGIEQFRKLAEYVPGPGDIVSFMLRDVADPEVVETYDLDAEFEEKWQGKLKDWTKWQGIDEEAMRYYWRAHWQWPAPTQLYEMLHRLREDTPLPGSDEVAKAVTIDDVLNVLGINDVAPVWRARLAAISYRMPMRREIAKMYEVGVLQKEDLKGRYQDIGYEGETAQALADYTVADSAERRAKFQGLPTRGLVIKLFKADGLTEDEATDLLQAAGVQEEAIQGIIDNAKRERDATVRAKLVAALKRRYMSGEFSDDDVISKLQQYGLAGDRIQVMSLVWREEKRLKRKEPSVANLCDWAGRGYITGDEWMRRLNNLGYDFTDASRFISSCNAKHAEELLQKAKKAAREAKQQAKEDSRCRLPPKPYCSVKRTETRTHAVSSVNGSAPKTTDTDTVTESSG